MLAPRPGRLDRIDGGVRADVRRERELYEEIRENALAIPSLEPRIRALFREMAQRRPDAAFPDLHFVVGARSAGGIGSPRGLVVAAEMGATPEDYLLLTAHELAHAQQPWPETPKAWM